MVFRVIWGLLSGADLGGARGLQPPPPLSGNHSEKGKFLLFANFKIKHFAFSECRKCHFRDSRCSKFSRARASPSDDRYAVGRPASPFPKSWIRPWLYLPACYTCPTVTALMQWTMRHLLYNRWRHKCSGGSCCVAMATSKEFMCHNCWSCQHFPGTLNSWKCGANSYTRRQWTRMADLCSTICLLNPLPSNTN